MSVAEEAGWAAAPWKPKMLLALRAVFSHFIQLLLIDHLLCAGCGPRGWGYKYSGYFSVFILLTLCKIRQSWSFFFLLKLHFNPLSQPCFSFSETMTLFTPNSQAIALWFPPILHFKMLVCSWVSFSSLSHSLDNHIQSHIFECHLQANETQVYVSSHKGKSIQPSSTWHLHFDV